MRAAVRKASKVDSCLGSMELVSRRQSRGCEKFVFVDYAKKSQKLSKAEARGLAPFFEVGLNEAVPALTSYVE